MLNIPVKGDGTIDSDERAFLEAIATWIPKHGEAIYGTRPFSVFGEGPPDVTNNSNFNERNQRAYTVGGHPLHAEGRHGVRLRLRVARQRQAHHQDAGQRGGRAAQAQCSASN